MMMIFSVLCALLVSFGSFFFFKLISILCPCGCSVFVSGPIITRHVALCKLYATVRDEQDGWQDLIYFRFILLACEKLENVQNAFSVQSHILEVACI